jgi:hypothetical protein
LGWKQHNYRKKGEVVTVGCKMSGKNGKKAKNRTEKTVNLLNEVINKG